MMDKSIAQNYLHTQRVFAQEQLHFDSTFIEEVHRGSIS